MQAMRTLAITSLWCASIKRVKERRGMSRSPSSWFLRTPEFLATAKEFARIIYLDQGEK